MTDDFATALRRALQKTCAADPGAATAIIQSALSGRHPAAAPRPGTDAAECGPCAALAAAAANAPDTAAPGRSASPAEGAATAADPSGRPGRTGLSGLSGMGARPGFSGMPDLSGLPGMPDLSGIAGMPDLSRLPGMADFSGLPGMADFSGLAGMGSVSAPAGLPGQAGRARPAPVPDGARVETRQHATAAGARAYRLFVPSSRPEGHAGLVLMLHGCTQTPEDFALGSRMDLAAEAAGFVVAYPGQTGAHNMQSCWNWFRPEDQSAASGEPALLADLARVLAAEFGLGGRVFVAGLSAGGAMAAVLAETHPDLFAAVGIHSGLPAGSAHDLPSAFAAMRGQGGGRPPRIPAIVFHGTADTTVAAANADRLVPGSGVETQGAGGGRTWSRLTTAQGSELWRVDGAGHAWFGGDPAGSYADAAGPDASAEMLRFFAETPART